MSLSNLLCLPVALLHNAVGLMNTPSLLDAVLIQSTFFRGFTSMEKIITTIFCCSQHYHPQWLCLFKLLGEYELRQHFIFLWDKRIISEFKSIGDKSTKSLKAQKSFWWSDSWFDQVPRLIPIKVCWNMWNKSVSNNLTEIDNLYSCLLHHSIDMYFHLWIFLVFNSRL